MPLARWPRGAGTTRCEVRGAAGSDWRVRAARCCRLHAAPMPSRCAPPSAAAHAPRHSPQATAARRPACTPAALPAAAAATAVCAAASAAQQQTRSSRSCRCSWDGAQSLLAIWMASSHKLLGKNHTADSLYVSLALPALDKRAAPGLLGTKSAAGFSLPAITRTPPQGPVAHAAQLRPARVDARAPADGGAGGHNRVERLALLAPLCSGARLG